jgi:hypothetical protein
MDRSGVPPTARAGTGRWPRRNAFGASASAPHGYATETGSVPKYPFLGGQNRAGG